MEVVTQELLIRMGLALLALFIFGKLLAPALGLWFWEKFFNAPKRSNNVDFDQLVESKKAVLQGASAKSPVQPLSGQRYQKALAGNEGGQILSKLFDSLQWGGGEEVRRMAGSLSKKLGVRAENGDVVRVLRLMLKKDWLFLRKSGNLPSLSEVASVVECYLFWEVVVGELNGRGGKLTKRLCSNWGVSGEHLKKAVVSVLTESPCQKILMDEVDFVGVDQLEARSSKVLITEDGKFFRTRKDWIGVLSEEVVFYSALSPLPELKDDRDREGALKVLGVGPEAGLDEVKKVYKRLALLKHPDRLAARGIPKQFEAVATENFSLIQRAYSILKG